MSVNTPATTPWPHNAHRPRRLRRSPILRHAVAETHLQASQLMQPYFVLPDAHACEPIAAMPGISRLGVEKLLVQAERGLRVGLKQIMLFGVLPDAHKDAHGSGSCDSDGPVAQSVRALKQAFGDALLVATDVCLCGYTSHGHCGVLHEGHVHNDASLAPLVAMARCHAEAGADMVAPSDMMDHRIGAIRRGLDAAGLTETAIMSYSVKYASAYYGPFRDAASSAPGHGDRRGYQMDYRNGREALREAQLDEAEGADILMVKPALAYLDVLAGLRARTALPLACYNVSGEYSMVKAASQAGLVNEAQMVRENLTAMARAGANLIITYHALDALEGQWLDC
jgi:porphobilinogen synthase